jgi:geranylgeranyl reductase family protein
VTRWDAVVVGAGPGGSAAAYFLARCGRRVLLLDRHRFPRDKSCGDGLTRPAVALLAEMGVVAQLGAAQSVGGVRVFMRGRGSREFLYPTDVHGLVVPRYTLDELICRRAVEAGAELREGVVVKRLLRDGGTVCGVEATDGTNTFPLHAPVVIAADGASSALASDAGLRARGEMGFAIRGYYAGIDGLDDLLEIHLPLLDVTDRYLLPSYGWVFPTGSGTANVGVGLFRREHGANVRQMMEQFVTTLRRDDRRFAGARACGAWRGAPLRFDFTPDRCAAPGLLLVGDAAGLVSPFTGEGIGYALQSGKLAAQTVDDALRDGSVQDLSAYGRRLGQVHAGYFETGRESARRYVLLWHVLESTFDNEKPLFALARQIVLFPEGVGESYVTSRLNDVRDRVGPLAPMLRADLVAASDVVSDALRRDWPFLPRLLAVENLGTSVPFRPALLLLLAAYCGAELSSLAPSLAAAVELGYLATLAQLSVRDDPPDTGTAAEPAANWGNMFAVIVGDFLLGKAYELSAQAGAEVSTIIAEALATACSGRTAELRYGSDPLLAPERYLEIIARKTATLFELPCVLGARLARLSGRQTAALRDYGRELGVAFQISEDVQSVRGEPREISVASETDMEEGVYGMPVLLALRQPGWDARPLRALLAKPHLDEHDRRGIGALAHESGAVDAALRMAQERIAAAVAHLAHLPEGHARQALHSLADHVVAHPRDRVVPPSPLRPVPVTVRPVAAAQMR